MAAPIVRAGRNRCRVQIQAAEYVQAASGQERRTWTTYHQTWASIEPIGSRERWDAEQVKSEVSHRVGLRTPWSKRIKSGDRVVYNGRVFEIEGVRDIMERKRLTLLDVKENPDHTVEEP